MFKYLSGKLSIALGRIKGRGYLSSNNIKGVLRDVRIALLEADVSLSVVKKIILIVKKKSLHKNFSLGLTPDKKFLFLLKKELSIILGNKIVLLNFSSSFLSVFLLVGVQGSGKTTTAAKLAKLLRVQHNKKVMIVSVDIYRPGAIKQLEILIEKLDVFFFNAKNYDNSILIAKNSILEANKKFCDVLIVDTAGRLHVNEGMMNEIKELYREISPLETIFVVDSMMGQDSVNVANYFNKNLDLTGIILTKIDGDSKGGAALSICSVTSKPILFFCAGEGIDSIEEFYPDRISSRILGMSDVLSLIDDVKQKIDNTHAKELVNKIRKGESFTMNDFKIQIDQMKKMGGIKSIFNRFSNDLLKKDFIKSEIFDNTEIIINSMTIRECINPEILKSSRKKRIAIGSGTKVQDVNVLLKQFFQMKKLIKKSRKKSNFSLVESIPDLNMRNFFKNISKIKDC